MLVDVVNRTLSSLIARELEPELAELTRKIAGVKGSQLGKIIGSSARDIVRRHADVAAAWRESQRVHAGRVSAMVKTTAERRAALEHINSVLDGMARERPLSAMEHLSRRLKERIEDKTGGLRRK